MRSFRIGQVIELWGAVYTILEHDLNEHTYRLAGIYCGPLTATEQQLVENAEIVQDLE